MTFTNEGLFDRSLRILAGIAFAVLAWILWPGTAALFAAALAVIALVTGAVGWCPLYAGCGISTAERRV